MAERVLATKAANALIDAEFALPASAEQILESVGLPVPKSADLVLSFFRHHYGGLWVAGRATLTDAELRFSPNALNRAVHSGPMDLCIALSRICHVELLPGWVTKIVAVHVPGGVVKLRCYGAARFADQIGAASSASD